MPAPDSPDDATFAWLEGLSLQDPVQARERLQSISKIEMDVSSLQKFFACLPKYLGELEDPDAAISHLSKFVSERDDPAGTLVVLQQDQDLLSGILKIFATSPSLASFLISDGESFHQLSSRAVHDPKVSLEILSQSLESVDSLSHASMLLRHSYSREVVRIAYEEFVGGLAPEKVGRQLADCASAVIEAALQYVTKRLGQRRGLPQRPDGTTPEVTVIGLGNLGGEEMGYASPSKLVFLYDTIDQKNVWHRDFYKNLVDDVVRLLRGDQARSHGLDIDLREGPRFEVGVNICSFREAARIYETSGRTWQRLSFVKARTVAGSPTVGKAFLKRMEPWVFQSYLSRVELAEVRTLRHKLEKRAELQPEAMSEISQVPGGRDDIELTIQFLQLLHGGDLVSVRCTNTYDAIVSLEHAGCLTHQEAALLSDNYARLCRLEHLVAVMFDRHRGRLPEENESRQRLAWHLGIRDANQAGDLEKFQQLLRETFEKNRRMINHLMLDAPGDGDAVAVETELLLDPEPDPAVVEATMTRHGLTDPRRAMEDLASLSTETVPFLSPHRCRHFFSSIAPALLEEISQAPDPSAALSSLVAVTDSLGAKATLWELLGNSRPTMQLMVRLCATTPYLSGILIDNPGMVDELIDSLLMNRLPSAQRLDAHSVELCRGAADIDRILHSFKNSAHLTIGVRDMLGKESLEATHQAIGDTAEAILRRTIEHEQETLAERYGDPVDSDDNPAELLTLALGKLGGREPNYHSDLDAIFLYSADGETKRRVGGHRQTLSNQLFFNQLAQRVLTRTNHSSPAGRLYELDSRLRQSDDESVWAMTIDEFLKRFEQGTAPLWQRLALCRARTISGSRTSRAETDARVAEVIECTQLTPAMVAEIRELRYRMQQTAREENLKRGEGGTVDVETISQMLTLRYAKESPQIIQQGTTASLAALTEAGHLDEKESIQLTRNYLTLRRIEASLRLMNTLARHELPEDDALMRNLAFLMNESDPAMIVAQCRQARHSNRVIFDQIFDRYSKA
ncbi:MAG: glutamate-ammonia-ligase adenylyltransferase [Rubripirellula sp.]